MTMAVRKSGDGFNRWKLVGILFGMTALISAIILALQPGVPGVRADIAFTARVGVVMFCVAFATSAICRLWPQYRWSRWQGRNRRFIGISYALVQTLHLGLVLAFARMAPETYVIAGGWWFNAYLAGLAQAFVIAMGLTSFDRPAIWMGRTRWSLLHRVGGYYVWAIFLIAFGRRMLANPNSVYTLATLLLVVVLALRLTAAAQRRERQSPRIDPVASH